MQRPAQMKTAGDEPPAVDELDGDSHVHHSCCSCIHLQAATIIIISGHVVALAFF